MKQTCNAQTVTLSRTDIPHADVFISWTGADRKLKERLVTYLKANGISCLESDSECCGNFERWSKDAVHKGSIFLLLLTENTVKKARNATAETPDYVGLEIAEQRKLENFGDRFLPVCTNLSLLEHTPWELPPKISACCLQNEPAEAELSALVHKLQNLLIDQAFTFYRSVNKPNPIELVPLYRLENACNVEDQFSNLFITRTLTETDKEGNPIRSDLTLDAESLCGDMLFLWGSAGSGKSRYLEYLSARLAIEAKDILAITVPCKRFRSGDFDPVEEMYHSFRSKCGIAAFYTRAHFENLLMSGCRLLLILDGLDEIPNATQTNQLLSALKQGLQVGGKPLSATFLFTSRNLSDAKRLSSADRNLRYYRLDPLTDENIRSLSEKLFILFQSQQKAGDFYLQVSQLDEEIRANPLLLSQLAIVYDTEDHIPKTAVEIYDTVFRICLNKDEHDQVPLSKLMQDILDKHSLDGLLKDFSRNRYESLSRGKQESVFDLFCDILEDSFGDRTEKAAEELLGYLRKRAILVNDDFYHKMFLEYFTAVSFYDKAFRLRGTIKNVQAIEDLFLHYNDPYWSAVIQLFLVKADSRIDEETTGELYRLLADLCGGDFTLLLDTCRELLRHGATAAEEVAVHILVNSVDGKYPAYGPLFWYIPEYDLYETALLALEKQADSADYGKMLALVRDVCFIFGQKNTVMDITDRVDGRILWQKAELAGVRGALCELFCTGATEYQGGEDIYPRCFNVKEAKAFLKSDQGTLGRMSTPFADELGLYSHDFVPVMQNACIGFAALPYDIAHVEKTLNAHSCRKLRGLALSSTETAQAAYLSFNSRHLQVCYLPETVAVPESDWQRDMPLRQFIWEQEEGLQYIRYGLMGVTEIGEEQFRGFTGITDLILPPTVSIIGDNAFADCKNLTSVTFTNPDVEIGRDAFRGSGVESVTLAPGMADISGFAECRALTSVSIPNSVRYIGSEAFAQCTALTELSLPEGLEMIGFAAFRGCSKLTELVIPESLTTIADGAFAHCETLSQITLPKRISFLFRNTFAYCRSLSQITLPDTLQGIGAGAFLCCSSLQEIRIPSAVSTIATATFQGCSNLTRVHLPEGLDEIEMTAFYGCKSLTEVSVPHGVKEIGNMAFAECSALESLHLPPHLEPRRRFYIKGAEEEKAIPAKPVKASPSSEYHTLILCLGTPPADPVTGECLVLSDPVITAEQVKDHLQNVDKLIVGEGFTAIASHAFFMANDLISVSLPNSLKVIKDGGFGMCQNLASVRLPDGLERIEETAFLQCASLSQIDLPQSVTYIGMMAFSLCCRLQNLCLPAGLRTISRSCFSMTAISEIVIPEGVQFIENGAFFGCEDLKTAVIAGSVTAIGSEAFRRCSQLTSVQMPDTLQELGESAFAGCHSLEQIQIPAGITALRWQTFDCCVNLKEITVPEGVTELEENVFKDCTALQSVTLPTSLRVIDHSAFTGCTEVTSVTLGQRFEDDIHYLFPDAKPKKITFI